MARLKKLQADPITAKSQLEAQQHGPNSKEHLQRKNIRRIRRQEQSRILNGTPKKRDKRKLASPANQRKKSKSHSSIYKWLRETNNTSTGRITVPTNNLFSKGISSSSYPAQSKSTAEDYSGVPDLVFSEFGFLNKNKSVSTADSGTNSGPDKDPSSIPVLPNRNFSHFFPVSPDSHGQVNIENENYFNHETLLDYNSLVPESQEDQSNTSFTLTQYRQKIDELYNDILSDLKLIESAAIDKESNHDLNYYQYESNSSNNDYYEYGKTPEKLSYYPPDSVVNNTPSYKNHRKSSQYAYNTLYKQWRNCKISSTNDCLKNFWWPSRP